MAKTSFHKHTAVAHLSGVS